MNEPAADRRASVVAERPLRLGPFVLIEELGRGGMGVVYRARHERSGEVVACKTVRGASGRELEGIRAEIRALARLRHPGVIRIVGEGVQDGTPWYAMELLSGRTLGDHTYTLWGGRFVSGAQSAKSAKTEGTLSATDEFAPGPVAAHAPLATRTAGAAASGKLRETLSIVRKLCAPLAHLHERGIVHRDLKPENVMVEPDGRLVLVDFGLVSRYRGAVGREVLEVAGSLVGTAYYMAPEQVRRTFVDARADLYALGCILYELVAGRHVFDGATATEVIEQHLSSQPVRPSQFVDGVPAALDDLVMQLLAKRPRDRIGYAEDVARALDGLLGGPSQSEIRTQPYLYRPDMVGRADVVAEGVRGLEGVRAGRGGALLLGGESGIGKTFVAMEIARQANLRKLQVVTGEGLAVVAGTEHTIAEAGGGPLHPFRGFLQAVADLCRERGAAATDRVLGARGRILAAHEPALLGLPGQDEYAEPAELPSEAARSRLLRAIAETLVAYARERPLLLVIDDLQWADEVSLAALQTLTQETLRDVPAFVLGTYRTDEVGPGLRALLESGVRDVRLGRLDEPAVAALVGDMLGMPTANEAMVQFLARTSEGNPFFVSEYLRAAATEGLLTRTAGRWQLATESSASESAYERLTLPRSLRGLVERRLGALSPDALALAETAAVLGREVDAALVGAILPWQGDRLTDALAELVARQVLERWPSPGYRFAHDKLRELAYARLEEDARRNLHRRAAEALEASDADAHAYRLAHHFRLAGQQEKAFHYVYLAGRRALAAGAFHAAHTHLATALALATEHAGVIRALDSTFERARLHRLFAEALSGIGDLNASLPVLRQAYALLAGRELPATRAGWVGLLAREAGRQALRRALPAGSESIVVTAHDEKPALEERATIANRLSFVYVFRNQPLEMLGTLTLAANLSERAAAEGPRAIPYALIGNVLGLAGLGRASRWYFAQARDTKPETAALNAAQIEGFYLANSSRFSEARTLLESALERSKTLGIAYETEAIDLALAHLELGGGELDTAEARARSTLESAVALGNMLHEWWARKYLAVAAMHRGRFAEAVELVQPAERGFRERGNVVDWVNVVAVIAAARLRGGDLDAAIEKLAEVQRGSNHRERMHVYEAHTFLPEVAIAAWARAKARREDESHFAKLAQGLVRGAAAYGRLFSIARPVALIHHGRIAILSGRPRKAVKLFERAERAAVANGMPLEQGFALLERARLVGSDARRCAILEQARAIFGPRRCLWHDDLATMLASGAAESDKLLSGV